MQNWVRYNSTQVCISLLSSNTKNTMNIIGMGIKRDLILLANNKPTSNAPKIIKTVPYSSRLPVPEQRIRLVISCLLAHSQSDISLLWCSVGLINIWDRTYHGQCQRYPECFSWRNDTLNILRATRKQNHCLSNQLDQWKAGQRISLFGGLDLN